MTKEGAEESKQSLYLCLHDTRNVWKSQCVKVIVKKVAAKGSKHLLSVCMTLGKCERVKVWKSLWRKWLQRGQNSLSICLRDSRKVWKSQSLKVFVKRGGCTGVKTVFLSDWYDIKTRTSGDFGMRRYAKLVKEGRKGEKILLQQRSIETVRWYCNQVAST